MSNYIPKVGDVLKYKYGTGKHRDFWGKYVVIVGRNWLRTLEFVNGNNPKGTEYKSTITYDWQSSFELVTGAELMFVDLD